MTTKREFKPVEEQIAYLRKGAAEIIREEELRAKLSNSLQTGKPLRVYLGVDPTAPDLHLGHTVVLRKLKHFQDLGHTAIFLIGDFSALIGDPTGQSDTRPPLTREQVDANAKTYLAQVFKILDPEKTEVRYNSEWLDKLTSYDIVRLCAKYPLARMLEREDFRQRLAAGWKEQLLRPSDESLPPGSAEKASLQLPSKDKAQPVKRPSSISIHELLYPLLTAYDAVTLQSDVELGATEQKFNILVHREIQREYGVPPEVVFTMPILVGLDGQRKMSKSLGNYVGITEAPSTMFGKLMSLSDDMMWPYFDLVTDRAPEEIAALASEVKSGAKHPMDVKMSLAKEIIAGFHGAAAAEKAAAEFQRVFRDRETPEEMKEFTLKSLGEAGGIFVRSKNLDIEEIQAVTGLSTQSEKWSRLLPYFGIVSSTSEAERIIKQGGFELDGNVVQNPAVKLDLTHAATYTLRLGKKKFLRIVVE
ncbi:MAG TPA: tyrosine--tRNA ligase [Candidatus Acidoferrales bacterium]|nr:tyrosine--tRNA ligase [Candidatus Acidoferrales bacterium]